jgi:hypothetical protein
MFTRRTRVQSVGTSLSFLLANWARTRAYSFDAENVGTVDASVRSLICSAFRKTLHFPNYRTGSLRVFMMFIGAKNRTTVCSAFPDVSQKLAIDK